MNPLGFLSNLLHGTENFVGGLVHGAGQAVNNVTHPQAPPPRPVQQRPAPRPQPQINLAAFAHVLQQIPNVHLHGIEQLTGHNNVTLGNVVNNAPIIGPLVRGAENAYQQGATHHLPSIGQFTKQFAQTGANSGLQLAGYLAPELKVLKGAGIGAKFINQAVPSAGLSVAGDLVGGNRNAKQIATDALLNGLGAGAINAAPSVLKLAKGAYKNSPLASEAGHINFGAPLNGPDLKTPQGINDHINFIKNQLDGMSGRLKDTQQRILTADGISPARKQVLLQKATQDLNNEANTLKGEMVSHIQTLNDMGHNHIPEASIPQGLPGLPEAPKGTAYAGENSYVINPSLKQRAVGFAKQVAEPFRPAPMEMPDSIMGRLKAAWADERGSIDLNAPLGKEPAKLDNLAIKNTELTTPKSSPPLGGEKPAVEPKIAGNKFTQSVKTSPEVSAEVRGAVSGQHAVRNTEQLMKDATASIQKEGLPKATDRIMGELSVPDGQASDTTLAHALQAAKAHDALGTASGHDTATSLYDQIAQHGVAKGQGVQILSQIARSSPAGLRNKAFKDLKKAGIDASKPENAHIKTEIQGHIDAISKMKDGPIRDFAIATLQKAVSKHLPQSKVDNAVSVWKAGLLSGVKTQQGNAISNSTFALLHKAADPLSTVADKLTSVVSGKRTKTVSFRGIGSGTKEGTVKGITGKDSTLRTGIDQRNIGDKYEQHAEINLGNKFLQKALGTPANFIFRGMNAADQPFYYSALKNSLYDQAKADAINQGLKGSKLTAHMTELATNPSEKMVEVATKEAQKAVLANDTIASNIIGAAHSYLRTQSPAPKVINRVADAVLNVVAPFVRVPTAFLSRTIDFTPLGVGREVFMQAAQKKFDQRALSTAIGEGLTGTGAIALGATLAGSGQLSGPYPKTDPKEAARWKAEGITENSVKIGNNWISLNYLGPLGMLFGAGARYQAAKQTGNVGAGIASASTGLGQDLMGQSFLQGFSGLSDAINDPARNAKSFLNSQISSLVPNISNDIANLFDPMQRQTNNPGQAIQARIPGLRNDLPAKADAFGNDLKQPSGGGLNTLIGVKPSASIDNPLYGELNRLGQTGNLVFPTDVKSIGTGKDAVKLTPEQTTARQKLVGQYLTPLWNQITGSSNYKTLDDAHKSQALSNALTDVNSAVNRVMLSQISPDKLTKGASASDINVLNGNASPEAYINKVLTSKTSATSPSARYQSNLSTYQAQVKAGTLTGPAQLKAQQSLAKEAVTSKYSQDVLDFYGLSKSAMNDYFKQNPQDAKKLYDQAKQLDSQLGANKFKHGLAIYSGKGKNATKAKKAPRLAFKQVHLSKAPRIKVAKAKTKGFKLASGKPSKKISLTA